MNSDSVGGEVQYLGSSGITQSCLEALEGLLHRRQDIVQVRLLTYSTSHRVSHSFLITCVGCEEVVIRDGFGSGYVGEGARGLSRALGLICSVDLELDEYEVDAKLFRRLNEAKLTWGDLERIRELRPVRPTRWYEYLEGFRVKTAANPGKLWDAVEPVIPFALIDPRIFDLAVHFWESPDAALMTGYRKLEGLIRKRIGSTESGAKLFSQAFSKDNSLLMWEGISDNEQRGRASIFAGTFMAFRNPRAHNVSAHERADYLRELLMLNQLYALEASAILRPQQAEEEALPASEKTG